MASKAATDRLKKELKRLQKDPVQYIDAVPEESDLLTWHYVITGPPDSVYAGGYYHGKLVFPKQYPYKPPGILMLTPSGRFRTNTRLCLSMSDFHPESWNPLWNVGTILSGVLSFMLENSPTYGSVDSTDEMKRLYAANSLAYNMRDKQFVELFPQYKQTYATQQQQTANATAATTSSLAAAATAALPTAAAQQPLLNNNAQALSAAAPNAQPGLQQPQHQEAAQQQQQRPGHAIDMLIIVLVIGALAFFVSWL